MNRKWIVAFCLLVSACLSGVLAQQPAEAIVVPVQIADREGVPVTDLELKNFRVYENQVAQEIRTFAKGENEGTYVLTFVPASNPSTAYRSIEVIVDRPNLRVRSRAGYIPGAANN